MVVKSILLLDADNHDISPENNQQPTNGDYEYYDNNINRRGRITHLPISYVIEYIKKISRKLKVFDITTAPEVKYTLNYIGTLAQDGTNSIFFFIDLFG